MKLRTYLRAADLQQVNGLPANVHVVGKVSQEEGHAVFHIFWNQSVALDPEVFVCRNPSHTHTHSHMLPQSKPSCSKHHLMVPLATQPISNLKYQKAVGEYLSGCRPGLKTFLYLYDLLSMAKLWPLELTLGICLALSSVILSEKHKRTWMLWASAALYRKPAACQESLAADCFPSQQTSRRTMTFVRPPEKKNKKNAGVRSADVRCRSWWGVADEHIYFWVRQYRGDALTLNGATCNIYKCLMIFIKKNNKTVHFWWSSYTLFLGVISFITHWFITVCVENSHCYDF